MAHVRQATVDPVEREPAQTRDDLEERWPVPKAVAFACLLSIGLWTLIVATVAYLI